MQTATVEAIGIRLEAVRRRIAAAAEAAGRDPDSITLVVVSKTHPAPVVAAAVAAGARDLGEIRVQETAVKRPDVPPARWHLIGPLQRNKVRPALELFDVVHTVDRPELVSRLHTQLEKGWPGRRLPVLVEVNIGREPQKAGVLPEEAAALLEDARACPTLRIEGLMAIPPAVDDPAASRPHFAAVRQLRDDLQDRTGHPLPELSMGMSGDFEVAITEGATIVRVGTAIFGPRAG